MRARSIRCWSVRRAKLRSGLLDKRACAAGGAGTHRLNLSDAVLVKDTHLDLLHHDFEKVLDGLISARLLGRFVEIEVESLKEARQALQMLLTLQKKHPIPCFIMLDNMKPAEIKKFAEELRAGNADSAGTLHEASNVNSSRNFKRCLEPAFRRSGKTDASKKSGLVFLEASGGITLKNIGKYARVGADVISVGAMTHSAPALDISLKIAPAQGGA